MQTVKKVSMVLNVEYQETFYSLMAAKLKFLFLVQILKGRKSVHGCFHCLSQ